VYFKHKIFGSGARNTVFILSKKKREIHVLAYLDNMKSLNKGHNSEGYKLRVMHL
jgi:hypothetical protein